MENSTDYIELTTVELVGKRFKDAQSELREKHNLTKEEFIEFVIESEPVYNSIQGAKKIENAWKNRVPDLRLTEIIQALLLIKRVTP